MDVHNAFLHCDLDEEVYTKMPPGFYVGRKGIVCKLWKSLYGLRQAPRCWFAKLVTSLLSYGFCQSYSDYSLFSIRQGKLELYVLIYVDDLIVAGNNSSDISAFKAYLGRCFHMKDLGVLKYFLGVEVARGPQHPRQEHWEAALRVVRYLKGRPGQECPAYCSEFGVSRVHEAYRGGCHYVCDAIRDGLLTTTHVSTAVQLADIFTKALGKEKFLYLLRKLGTTFLPAPT
ncbi:transmembrane signal receptor [Lithospermum erythrorhizon]|uniref:Transmembrane signal receptor n=1 Tax=Lithospermum erythrorhizon TaxID=34254 RepID=A0AAV3QVU3_LITER